MAPNEPGGSRRGRTTRRWAGGFLTAAVLLALGAASGMADPPPSGNASNKEDAPIDFEKEIVPLLDACRPCHFPGGEMHGKLPLDDEKTVRELGKGLSDRFDDPDEKSLYLAFLAQPPTEEGDR